MPASRRLLPLLLITISLALPGCSGCAKPPPPMTEPPKDAAKEPEAPVQDFQKPTEPPESARSTEKSGESAPDSQADGQAKSAGDASRDSTAEAEGRSESPVTTPGRERTGSPNILPPETQIRDWLKQARREQAGGRPGKAYSLAADASGQVRRVKDAGQRAALQAEVDAVLSAVEPAVERATRKADTSTDDKPLIEK